ncbi:MAG TPA: toprim domain-containing protein [Bryobacteraceae bacterium]|jgi:DNA primase
MDWVSFDEIKKLVTLQMAIERYGIPLRRMNPTTLRGKCPLPMHRSDKSTESFTATLNKGMGGAWACQSQSCIKARGRVGGNVLDFVAAMEKCSIRDAAIKLQTWFLVPAAGVQSATPGKESARAENISADKEPKTISASEKNNGMEKGESNLPLTFELRNIDHYHPYLYERGVGDEIAKTFGVGLFSGKGSMHGRIVIPIHDSNGELIAYAGRSIDGTEPRYKFPAGFHKSLELYNLHRVQAKLSAVLVEGFFDCMKVTQAGFPCIALMGSTMSIAQENLLADRFAQIAIMLDGDEAGRGAAVEIADRLRRRVYDVQLVELSDSVQPDQLSEDELQKLLDSIQILR